MDQEELRSLIDEAGDQSLLIQVADDTVKEFFSHLRCPECGSSVTPVVNPKRPFKDGQISPNFLAQCNSCGCEFEPYSRIIIKTGQLRTYGDPRDPENPIPER